MGFSDDLEQVIAAFCWPPRSKVVELPDATVQIMGSKFTRGGEQVDGTISLYDLLTTP
jgi:hypothetical protein